MPAPPEPAIAAPTLPGGRASCGSPARSNIPRRWCSPPPWRRCRTPSRPTGPSCRNGWLRTASCRTPSSKASCWPAKPMPAISPPTTASAPAGRPSTAARKKMGTRRSIPRSSPQTARPCPARYASAGAGCSATAPAAARDARSPPSSSTTGCAAVSAPSGSPSPTSCWKTRAATGAHWAGWRAMSSPWAISGRGWRYPSTRASCLPPTPRCARRPARGSPRGSTRSCSGSPARWMRTTAMHSTASSSSTRPTPWRTPPGRSPNAARSSRPSRAAPA